MRILTVCFTVSFCLSAAASARAQSTTAWERQAAPRTPLVSLRGELLRPLGPTKLEDLRVRPEPAPSIKGLASVPNKPDRARSARVCPMPVARPDTTAIERMPVSRTDSTRNTSMPVIAGCENPLFR